MKFRALLPLLVLMPLCGTALAEPVSDSARGAARSLAEEGVSALQSGDSATAVDKLERAYQIVKLPAVGLWSARALVHANRWVNAAERYLEVTRWKGTSSEAQVQEQAIAAATKERDELVPRIPSVTISVAGADANDVMVSLDGVPVLAALIGTSQPVDPKHHVVRGTRGADVVEQSFDGVEGQHGTVTLTFGAPATAAATPPAAATTTTTVPAAATAPVEPASDHGSSLGKQKIIGIAVGGAGVVAGAVGGVFLLNALSKKSDADKFCHGGACTSEQGVTQLSDARSAGNVATIAGIAGLVLVSAGVVLFVTAPSSSPEKTTFTIGPAYAKGGGSVVAGGSF